MLFAAGALLAVADSDMRTRVASISSVSGGSIASAGTLGGFADPTSDDSDPMGDRVARLASLGMSHTIATETVLRRGLFALATLALPFLLLMINPLGTAPVAAQNSPNPPRAAEDFLEWLRNSEALLAQLNYLAIAVPLLLAIAVPVIAIVYFFTALVQSWYSVQAAVEQLSAASLARDDRPEGETLSTGQGPAPEPTRIYCATDLRTGSHVYLSASRVLAPGVVGTSPNVYLADAVAASACFPGFRPLAFDARELGLAGTADAGPTRTRRHLGRLGVGLLGASGAAIAVAAVAMRISGILSGRDGLVLALAGIATGAIVAWGCARLLRSTDTLTLVDGGVCDNLGAAFSLLARDDRYAGLPALAGSDEPGLMLVVDASKPFSTGKGSDLEELVPLRLRGAQRSMLALLNSANASARRHVIQTSLAANGPLRGAFVSIGQAPTVAPDDFAQAGSLAQENSAVPTTLSARTPDVVFRLIVQGYRLTQAELVRAGRRLERTRSDADIAQDLFLRERATEKQSRSWQKWLAEPGAPIPLIPRRMRVHGSGPYARRARLLRVLGWLAQLASFALAIWAVVLTYQLFVG
ncbi:hypothetical protein MK786_03090 [Microbacterium sp. CFH 31415]|uniref:hypothetical protein n=1 Tax=Microbacterium sp. CFH 31415 TaxID=2921732 RepID=UPI001F1486A1|nr:hypothetical protein [Microbacterium sp. CFH 31415]MCH6229716.1 hypothetical protein [Microbacterium sp. CFH 31415]